MPKLRKRTTDSSLHLPSPGDAFRLFGRVARLRCPHCGNGPVLRKTGAVMRRCSGCNLRFERSDENYFSGAMFFGLMLGEAILGLSILIICIAMSPNVPWDTLQWAGPLGCLLVMIVVIPVSRVVWLGVDVLVRPVQAEELSGSD